MAAPLIARMVIDAQTELMRAIEHVPGPGRERAIGRLNSAGWVIAHAAETHDYWINVDCGGGELDPWLAEWSTAQRALPSGDALPTAYGEAAEAFGRVAERATAYLDERAVAEADDVVRGFDGSAWEGRTRGYLIARAAAHLFAHAGELSVIASLVLWGDRDLGLPGRLARSLGAGSEAVEPTGELPAAVRLLLDARGEFRRVAAAAPVPAQRGAFARLNAGAWIVAHAAEQDDQYWTVHAQGGEPDKWLAAANVRFGDEQSVPDYGLSLVALDASFGRSLPFVEGLDGSEFDRAVRKSRVSGRGDQTIADLMVLQTAHLFALSGELAAISSLAGAEDPGLPGRLAHVAGS
jgi:hypothetical protein